MTPERWEQVERLYHAAQARAAGERAAFLETACAADADLRREVESLLTRSASADGLLGEPAMDIAAQMVSTPENSMLIGRRIGAYQIQALLGACGMGEVYRARDTKLERDVAIKILPRIFTSDRERLARFEGEARMLAALNHPHIGAIYGVEEAAGVRALILELVEGETLAERIAKGSGAGNGSGLPLADALMIAHQIVEALEAAHRRGILHRDLKPLNIMVTWDGTAKLLDFGLAKIVGVDADVTRTLEGTVLGTAAYMSPEQAQGQSLDARSDVFSFGAVLYEMLSGRRAFGGRSTADVLSAVLRDDPQPIQGPPALKRVVRRCLAKQPGQRFQTIEQLRQPLVGIGQPLDLRQPGTQCLNLVPLRRDGRVRFGGVAALEGDGLAEFLESLAGALAVLFSGGDRRADAGELLTCSRPQSFNTRDAPQELSNHFWRTVRFTP